LEFMNGRCVRRCGGTAISTNRRQPAGDCRIANSLQKQASRTFTNHRRVQSQVTISMFEHRQNRVATRQFYRVWRGALVLASGHRGRARIGMVGYRAFEPMSGWMPSSCGDDSVRHGPCRRCKRWRQDFCRCLRCSAVWRPHESRIILRRPSTGSPQFSSGEAKREAKRAGNTSSLIGRPCCARPSIMAASNAALPLPRFYFALRARRAISGHALATQVSRVGNDTSSLTRRTCRRR